MSVDGFNYDNPLIRLLNRLGDVIILSLVFTLFSLPIFTIGASVTALYYTAMKSMSIEDGYVFKFFLKSFKENFKQSTIIWLISVVVLTVLGVDVWFWVSQWKEYGTGMARPMIVISVVMLSLAVMIIMYVFPLQAKFDNNVKVQFRNAFLLSIKYFPNTIIMAVIIAVVVWAFYYYTILALIVFAFIGFGILGFVFAFLMSRCFKPYLEQTKQDAAETEAGAEEEAETEAQSGEETETEAQSGEETETEAQSGEETETEAQSGEETETEAQSGEETETEAQSGEETKTEAGEDEKNQGP